MPELPEVHTTTTMLNALAKGLCILDVWTDYKSNYYKDKKEVKNPSYFLYFKKEVVGEKIKGFSRKGKNVIMSLSQGRNVLIHMKMTGHLLFGQYEKVRKNKKISWIPKDKKGVLNDKTNGFIHLVFVLSNKKHIVLSDMRKFAKISLIKARDLTKESILQNIGPDPIQDKINFETFQEIIGKRPKTKIKTALMDQSLISGIGNIYSDEILWASKIHPERSVKSLKKQELKNVFQKVKKILLKGIKSGGDSMSDYRNPLGEKGGFQKCHNVYKRKKLPCSRTICKGFVERKIINGRSAHFCPCCQK